MKIAIPENVTNSLRFKVGDLYAAGGNSSNTAGIGRAVPNDNKLSAKAQR